MDEEKLYQRAIDLWGRFAQEDMFFEERNELEYVLILRLLRKFTQLEFLMLKLRRVKTKEHAVNHIKAISEEIADCEIMLGQLKILYKIEERVKEHKKFKLERLEQRIKKYKEKNQK